MDLGATIIRPDDKAWLVDGGNFWVPAYAAVSRNCCAFIAAIGNNEHDYFDPENPYCRFYKFDAGMWICSEVRAQIVSLLAYQEAGWSETGLAVLDISGRLWFLGAKGYESKIDVADADNLGHLRLLDNRLYATGHNGQIYCREGEKWRHDDAGLLNAAPTIPRPRRGDKGRGFSESDLLITMDGGEAYCCGTMYLARPGLFWRPRGAQWQWLGVDSDNKELDFINLAGLHELSKDNILISTRQGFLLKGNAKRGFKPFTDAQVDEFGASVIFSNIVKFREEIFIGGTTVCRLNLDGTLEPQIGTPQSRLGLPQFVKSSIEGALSIADGVLWAIGEGILSRFDGVTWEQILMPSIFRNSRR